MSTLKEDSVKNGNILINHHKLNIFYQKKKPESAIENEIEALRLMFCEDGEFIEEKYNDERKLIINIDVDGDKWNLNFLLSAKYPFESPKINVYNENFNRKDLADTIIKAEEYGQSLSGNYMILDIISWFHDELTKYTRAKTNKFEENCTEPMYYTTLIQVHHMRAKEKYVKLLETWMMNFDLTGRILFYKKAIYILVQGKDENIKVTLLQLHQ